MFTWFSHPYSSLVIHFRIIWITPWKFLFLIIDCKGFLMILAQVKKSILHPSTFVRIRPKVSGKESKCQDSSEEDVTVVIGPKLVQQIWRYREEVSFGKAGRSQLEKQKHIWGTRSSRGNVKWTGNAHRRTELGKRRGFHIYSSSEQARGYSKLEKEVQSPQNKPVLMACGCEMGNQSSGLYLIHITD